MVLLRISCSSRHDFQCKILHVIVAIRFSFYHFDFVINAFKLSGMDVIFAFLEIPNEWIFTRLN